MGKKVETLEELMQSNMSVILNNVMYSNFCFWYPRVPFLKIVFSCLFIYHLYYLQ